MDALRPATHFQASGHDALAAQTTLDTGIHRLPDGIKTLIKRRTAHHRLFIRSFHLRDRQAGTCCHFKHLFRRGKRKRHIGRRLLVLLATHRLQLGIGDHEAAADGVIDLCQQKPAVLIEGGKPHAVGVTGQGLLLIENQILGRIEMIGRMARRRDAARLFHVLDDGVHPVRIHLVRQLARQTRITARPVPCPMPVWASEPWRLAFSDATWALCGRGQSSDRISSRNRAAADIGPIVCELEGPIPILKTSKTERNMIGARLVRIQPPHLIRRPDFRKPPIGMR